MHTTFQKSVILSIQAVLHEPTMQPYLLEGPEKRPMVLIVPGGGQEQVSKRTCPTQGRSRGAPPPKKRSLL